MEYLNIKIQKVSFKLPRIYRNVQLTDIIKVLSQEQDLQNYRVGQEQCHIVVENNSVRGAYQHSIPHDIAIDVIERYCAYHKKWWKLDYIELNLEGYQEDYGEFIAHINRAR